MDKDSMIDSGANREMANLAQNTLKALQAVCFRRGVYGRVGIHYEIKDGTAVEIVETREVRFRK